MIEFKEIDTEFRFTSNTTTILDKLNSLGYIDLANLIGQLEVLIETTQKKNLKLNYNNFCELQMTYQQAIKIVNMYYVEYA